MRNELFGRCALACAMFFCCASAWADVTSKPERVQIVRIAYTGPLSGPNSAIGIDALNGMQIAVDRLNQQGIELDGKSLRFETVVRDDQADGQRGAEIARELWGTGISAVLGPLNSAVALAAVKTYSDGQIPVLTAASNPKVTSGNLPFIFRIVVSDADIGAKMAQYAARTLKPRSAAIIDDGSPFAQGLLDAFVKSAKSLGLPTVHRELIPDRGGNDPAALDALQRIRESGAQAVFIGAHPVQSGRLLRQMRQMGMDIPVLSGDAMCSAPAIQAAEGAAGDNTYCVLGTNWLTKVADGAVFAAGFQRKFGRAPDVYAATYFDGVMVLAQAIKSAGSIEGRQLAPALARSRYKGITASYEFNAQRELKDSTVTILRIKGSELVPLASF